MPRILISAFIGSDNLGDEAIFESILANLNLPKNDVTVTSVNLEKTTKHSVTPIPAKSPTALYKAIKNTDIVLMGGGGIIQDQSSILNILYYSYQLGLAKFFKKPVVLCFVGVGPVSHALSRFVFRRVSSAIKLAIVRDEKSVGILRDITYPTLEVKSFHDPVLNYPIDIDKVSEPSNEVVVSLRKWYFSVPLLPASLARKINSMGIRTKKYNGLVSAFARDFDTFLDNNPDAKLNFVSFYDSEDMEISLDVIKSMKNSDRCLKPQSNITVGQYVSAVAKSRALFGMRLHSLILSAVAGKSFAAINYSSKVKEFVDQMNMSEYMSNVDEYESGVFYERLQSAYDDAHNNDPVVLSKKDDYAANNDQAFDLIRQFIK